MFTTVRRPAIRCRRALAALFVGTLGLSGCTPLDEFAVHSLGGGGENQFYTGINSLVSCDQPLNVVFVHGMGGYAKGDPGTLIKKIREQNHLEEANITETEELVDENRVKLGNIRITEYFRKCSDRPKKLLTTFIINWTASTSPKITVSEVDQEDWYTRHRLEKHNEFKQSLLNKNLADALLYAGKYRKTLQRAVRLGFEKVSDHYWNRDTNNNVVIAFSLGSSLVFDVLKQMETEKKYQKFANDFRRNTIRFFMVSNQILLLSLTDEPPHDTDKAFADEGPPPCAEALKSYIEKRRGGLRNTGKANRECCFSDYLTVDFPDYFGRRSA